jgi:hypothetical protein
MAAVSASAATTTTRAEEDLKLLEASKEKLLHLSCMPSLAAVASLREAVVAALPETERTLPDFFAALQDSTNDRIPDTQLFLVFAMCAAYDSCSTAMEKWNGPQWHTKSARFTLYVRESFHRMIRAMPLPSSPGGGGKRPEDTGVRASTIILFSKHMRLCYLHMSD